MDNEKLSNAIKALAKELEGRGQMHGIVLELVVLLLKHVREEK
jgi:hypothetical protein